MRQQQTQLQATCCDCHVLHRQWLTTILLSLLYKTNWPRIGCRRTCLTTGAVHFRINRRGGRRHRSTFALWHTGSELFPKNFNLSEKCPFFRRKCFTVAVSRKIATFCPPPTFFNPRHTFFLPFVTFPHFSFIHCLLLFFSSYLLNPASCTL